MLNITLLCVGGLKESFWKEACAEYQKRLGAWARVTVEEIQEERIPADPKPAEIEGALETEARRIEGKLPKGAFITALCVEGRQMDSERFAAAIEKAMQSTGRLAFIIGGSFGLAERIKGRADLRLSLSCMTFPHMTARVLLLEQVYRAMSILNGSKYHK